MAILKPFAVEIKVQGSALVEYDLPPDSHTPSNEGSDKNALKALRRDVLVEKYVEAPTDTNFSICTRVKGKIDWKGETQLVVYFYVDGIYIDGMVVSRNRIEAQSSWSETLRGSTKREHGKWHKRKFKFTDIRLSDESLSKTNVEIRDSYKSLGQIKVEFWRWRNGKSIPGTKNPTNKPSNTLGLSRQVPEIATKFSQQDLSVQLEEPKQCKPLNLINGKYIGSRPLAKFVFHYRGKEALYCLGILERPREPTPILDRDPDSLGPEEMLQYIKAQHAQNAALQEALKRKAADQKQREHQADDASTTPKRKRESSDDTSSDAEIEVITVKKEAKSEPEFWGEISD